MAKVTGRPRESRWNEYRSVPASCLAIPYAVRAQMHKHDHRENETSERGQVNVQRKEGCWLYPDRPATKDRIVEETNS